MYLESKDKKNANMSESSKILFRGNKMAKISTKIAFITLVFWGVERSGMICLRMSFERSKRLKKRRI